MINPSIWWRRAATSLVLRPEQASRISHRPWPSFPFCHGGQTESWTGKSWTGLGDSSALAEKTLVLPDDVHRFPHRVRTHDAVEAEKEFQKTSWLVPSHAQIVVMTECRDMVLSYSDDQLHWRAQGQEGSDPYAWYIYIYIKIIYIYIYTCVVITSSTMI